MILNSNKLITNDNLNEFFPRYLEILENLADENNLYTGWINNEYFDKDILEGLINDIAKFKSLAKTMIVIGIGGSYLGAKAISDALQNNILANEYNLIFMGQNISSDYLNEVLAYVKNNDVVVNVISKSGTTLEPSLAFELIKEAMLTKYGQDEMLQRIIVTTDKCNGTLRKYVNENDIVSFEVPATMGGRYSVFSPVGLIPLTFIGIDIVRLVAGAEKAKEDCFIPEINPAFIYAVNRYLLHTKYQKEVESFVVFTPYLVSLLEWLKQLFAESEGKNQKGLLPMGMVFTTDLHSLGQFIQDGNKLLFETIISFNQGSSLKLAKSYNENELLKYKKHEFVEIEKLIKKGVIKAHEQGEVPIIELILEQRDEYHIGYLMSFMMYACAYSANLLEVNPFDQNGVEIYKKEVKALF